LQCAGNLLGLLVRNIPIGIPDSLFDLSVVDGVWFKVEEKEYFGGPPLQRLLAQDSSTSKARLNEIVSALDSA
jgi:hypothetical protein